MFQKDKYFTLSLKKRAQKQYANIIKGIDPVSIGLLKQMYAALKDRGDNLGLYEKVWVKEIERIYSDKDTYDSYFINGLDTLLKQALKILGDNDAPWDIREEELYSVFQKLLFLKARDGLFKDFFDNIEQTILSAVQLDFSKRASLTKIGDNQENIFSYAAVMLNTLLETLERSVISSDAVNMMLEQIPGAIIIITDKNEKIKFISKLGARVFKGDEEGLIGQPLTS